MRDTRVMTGHENSRLGTSLYRTVWQSSKTGQVKVCMTALLSFPLDLAPLELQRRKIDDAISTTDLQLLMILAGVYALVIVTQQAVKFALNYSRGLLGERFIAFLRSTVLRRGWRDSQTGAADDDKAGALASIVGAEVEPLGGFAGDAIALPLIEGGMMVSVMGYMLWTAPLLAAVAIVTFIPQAVMAPVVQKRINLRSKKRVGALRSLGNDAVQSTQPDDARPSDDTATTSSTVLSREHVDARLLTE